jgi:hypothetical protein
MNPLAYFTLELMHQHRREEERAVRLRRQRVGDDEPLSDARDRRWAAAIRRYATGADAAESAESRPASRPDSRPVGQPLGHPST